MTSSTASRPIHRIDAADRYVTAAQAALTAIEANRVKMARVTDDRARLQQACVALGVATAIGLVNGHTITPDITAARAAHTAAAARLAKSAGLALETSRAAEAATAALSEILDQIRQARA